MSNIYDALEKSGEGGKRQAGDPLEPLTPRGSRGAALPRPVGGKREIELEGLRQRVLLSLDLSRPCTITFSGAVPGEGASTLALLFAREVAQWEQRPVLLIDADLGGFPKSLSGALKQAADGPGLAEVLDGSARLDEAVRQTEQPFLHFLPKGTSTASPLDIVSADRLKPLRAELERHYAFTVIDASPILLAPETSALAATTDGIVLVVRAHRTRREIVQKAIKQLNQARAKTLGVVLNGRRYPIPGFIYRRL